MRASGRRLSVASNQFLDRRNLDHASTEAEQVGRLHGIEGTRDVEAVIIHFSGKAHHLDFKHLSSAWVHAMRDEEAADALV